MIIKALAENTSVSEEYSAEHGLSLYIETSRHKLLFDTGRGGLFLENAEKMGIDLTKVDTAVISHGHYDHGGGLPYFLEYNQTAKIYAHEKAFGDYYSSRPDGTAYIGLNKNLRVHPQIVFTDGFLQIDEELSLFSDVQGNELPSLSNKVLLAKEEENFVEDAFRHEQNLIINENGKTVLLAGCAHNGIVNIIEHCKQITGRYADIVIGGIHLFNPSTKDSESPELVAAIAERLKSTGSQYYTCHCTGLTAFEQLHEVMQNKLQYLSTGSIVEI